MERTRRSGTKVELRAGFAELRKLRESGRTRLSTYEVEKEEDLYDEVDEDEYKKVVRDRLNEDDFVVDDGGEGYVDNGMDGWGDEVRYYSDDEEEMDGKRLSKKELKRKREEDKERKSKQEGDLHKYFNKPGMAPMKAKATTTTVHEKEFLDDLLGEFDTTAVRKVSPLKKIKVEPARKARKLSPPRKGTKKFNTGDFGSSTAIPNSPPPADGFNYDVNIPDDDTPMSDAPIPPSSPTIKAEGGVPDSGDGDDDEFEVAEIKGNKNIRTTRVNIASSRPTKPAPFVTPAANSLVKTTTIDSSTWTNVTGGLNVVASSPMPDKVSFRTLAPSNVTEEDGSIKMFWMDYTEVNGSLILFGKVKDQHTGRFVSAFLKVDGIMRNLFFLPREYKGRLGRITDEEVQMEDVYQEVTTFMLEQNFDGFKAKPTSRKYAFELAGIPREGDYLKVLYPYTKLPLPIDLQGETFSRVFGTNTALFEQFVLCRNLMGPCWLKIDGAKFNTVQGASWCKIEMQIDTPQQATIMGDADSSEAPPLTIMSIALRTIHNIRENKQEIVSISARVYEDVSLADATTEIEKMPHQVFTIARPVQSVFPSGFEKLKEQHTGNIKLEKSESMLLSAFMAKLQQADPDILMGHQLENVDYPVLLHRMKEKKTPNWSRIGRLKRSSWPSNGGGSFAGSFFVERQMASGRLLCDLANDLGKSLMLKCQSWSLTEMCDLILGKKRQEFDNEEALKTWANSSKGFLDYLIHCEVDTYFIAAVALKIQMLPLTKQLTNLAGNSWARTLGGTRAERNEYILLHEFYRNKYICPDKVSKKANKIQKDDEKNPNKADSKKKDKYKGGLVFDPERGLYDKHILVMDFNSLYPSIIQEYNICFTTVDRSNSDGDEVPAVPEEQTLGILPRLISTLVQRRRQVKSLMNDKRATAVQKTQWDIKQQALKLTANSMYGCLGYTRSRFYARPLAMLTTYKGREILQSTKDLAESMSLQVIYGDTDSVMINTLADNYADAIKIGQDFKKQVNDRYRLLEIDIDGVFQRLLLHAKKKYAAVTCIMINGKIDTRMEVKGLDMRRREYCQLSKEASAHILNEVFTGNEKEVVVERIHDYLRDLAGKMREGQFPLMKYTIYTKLGKNPEDYPSGKTMPQVQVALRKKTRGESVMVGDVISYIITEGGDGQSDIHSANRAYSTQDVVKPDSGLKPDPEWYLVKQIFPPIERLCAPIEGTNSLRLAECLGLDIRKYQFAGSNSTWEDREIHPLESMIPDEERFKDAAKLSLRCRYCKEAFQFEGLIGSKDHCTPQGIVCRNAGCEKILPVVSIAAQVEYQIRQISARYYDAWLVCDDSSCGNRTRQISVYGKRCLGPKGLARGCRGVMHYEYTDKMLYNQLLYFRTLFDVDKAKDKAKLEVKDAVTTLGIQNSQRFAVIDGCVGRYLEKCGRQWVGMQGIFGFTMV